MKLAHGDSQCKKNISAILRIMLADDVILCCTPTLNGASAVQREMVLSLSLSLFLSMSVRDCMEMNVKPTCFISPLHEYNTKLGCCCENGNNT